MPSFSPSIIKPLCSSDINLLAASRPYFFNGSEDLYGCCRWSTHVDEPLLFVKHTMSLLNILDTEKKALTLKEPIQIDSDCKFC